MREIHARAYRITVTAGCLCMALSCSKPNDPNIPASQAIRGFINSSRDIAEIFTLAIQPPDTLTLDSVGSFLRRDVLLSAFRQSIAVTIDSVVKRQTSFGLVFTAYATFSDGFSHSLFEAGGASPDSLWRPWSVPYGRRALFYQLEPYASAFQGWRLVGWDLAEGAPYSMLPGVTITLYPVSGAARVISNKERVTDAVYKSYMYTTQMDVLRGGDSVHILTALPQNIYARTAQGYRRLGQKALSPSGYAYGFRTPAANANERYFHTLSFQNGPRLVIDTTSPPPDTLVDFDHPWTFVYGLQ